MDRNITFGILTVSDRCSIGQEEDTAGPELCIDIKRKYPKWKIVLQEIVPDDQDKIEDLLKFWSSQDCDLILTVGGTGCSPRDVTPEATRAVISKEVPGISQTMIMKSLNITDRAMLSRPVCGIRNRSLIINLPGSEKGAKECFSFVSSCIPHAIALITDDKPKVSTEHAEMKCNSISSSEVKLDRNAQTSTQYTGIEKDIAPSKVKMNCAALRDRQSIYPMVEVDEANKIILRECNPTIETEEISIENALHRVLAEPIYAKDPLPPFRASIKDGYAIRVGIDSSERKVRAAVAAGDKPDDTPLLPDEAVRISTGAPIPEAADAVIQVEDTKLVEVTADGNEEVKISLLKTPILGQDIRGVGSDISANSKVLDMCEVITGAHIGVLATVGRKNVKVFKRKTVGVLSTGNELRSHHDVLGPGQIRDSNKLTLINLLKEFSYEAQDCGIAKDNPDSVKSALSRAFESNDIVVTTGGVSMGEFDLIKRVLIEDFNAIIHFGRVNMKPGKPTTFSTLFYKEKMKIVFGLPGNPSSACATSILFLLPCLKYLERRKDYIFPRVNVFMNKPLINNDERPSYMRAKWEFVGGHIVAKVTENQISSRINDFLGANGLIQVPKSKPQPHPQTTSLYGSNGPSSCTYSMIIFK